MRPFVLSIAGFDPSGGAGILSDCKTFEMHKVYGLGIVSAITFQHEDQFTGLHWTPVDQILKQWEILSSKYNIRYVKIGLIESLEVLQVIVHEIKRKEPDCRIVWDPVIRASAGYTFHSALDIKLLESICSMISLITPNLPEIKIMYPEIPPDKAAATLSHICRVLLKGGHSEQERGKDFLFDKGKQWVFNPRIKSDYEKHGSGCVLSSSIVANLAKGNAMHTACLRAKKYIGKFLNSNKTLLGFHKL